MADGDLQLDDRDFRGPVTGRDNRFKPRGRFLRARFPASGQIDWQFRREPVDVT